MSKIAMIVWDMDGTIADLYGVPDWLAKLRAEDATPYKQAPAMLDMETLCGVLDMLMAQGIQNRVVTWLSKGASDMYKAKARIAKQEWLADQGFPYDHFHGIQYGATKASAVRHALPAGTEAVLIDDNAKVRDGWSLGPALDPTTDDVIGFLAGLLGQDE